MQKQQQLKVQQQQRQKQLARFEQLSQKQKDMQPQLSSKRFFTPMQELRNRLDQSSPQEMVDKQRQQREAFELLDTNNYNVQGMSAERISTNQNLQGSFQPRTVLGSKTVPPKRGTSVSVLYPKTPQQFYPRPSIDRKIPTSSKVTTLAASELNQQQINPILETYSAKGLTDTTLISSAVDREVLDKSRATATEIMPRLASWQAALSPPSQRSEFQKASKALDQNLKHLTLQPLKDNQRNVHSPFSNEITSLGVDMKRLSQSQNRIQVQVESPVAAPLRNSGFSKVSSIRNQNVQDVNFQPVKVNGEKADSSIINETKSLGINANTINQSQDRVLSLTRSPSYASSRKGSNLQSLQKTEGPLQQFSVKPATLTLQAKNRSTLGMQLRLPLNITSPLAKQGYLKDAVKGHPHAKSAKKEKLFYFPIKRDTLISLLPMHLQAKYRSLRDTRNENSTQIVSLSKSIENSTVKMEDIKSPNISLKNGFHISQYKYSVEQIKTGNDSITEYFYLPSKMTAKIAKASSVNSSVNDHYSLKKDSIGSEDGTD